MADAIITVEDQTVIVTYSGAETVSASFVQLEALAAAAEAAAEDADADADRAEAAAVTTEDVRDVVLLEGYLPRGWVDPDEYTGVTYQNDYGVKFYRDGLRYWAMMQDEPATLDGWRSGGIRVRHPDDGLWYVSVKMGLVYDPILQGVAPTTIWVNNGTAIADPVVGAGNDTTGDGSQATPYKTMEKAQTVIVASGDDVFEVKLITNTFFGGNSAGWNSTTQDFADKRVTVTGVDVAGRKTWWLPGMRNTYTKALFAWEDMGDGIWKSAVGTGTISANAKNTDIVIDLSVTNADGAGTPSAYMAGPFADEAAILAAMAERPSFHNTAANVQYVKLASGDEPDPGVNFAYVETPTGNLIEGDEGGRFKLQNVRCVFNGGNSLEVGLLRFRPSTFDLDPPAAAVVHDFHVVLQDVEMYGANADSFRAQSVSRFIIQDCKFGLTREDGADTSPLYQYPALSTSQTEGIDDHMWVDGLIGGSHGDYEWRDQPTQTSSGNFITGHSQAWVTALNCRGGGTVGSGLAFVGGSRCLALNVNCTDPQDVTPATDVYPAPYLASGNRPSDTSYASAIYAIDCAGGVRPTGKMFYVGPTADIVAAHFRGTVTKQVESGGTLTDGYGNNL